MKLSDYIRLKKLDGSSVARAIGVSKTSVSRYCSEVRIPDPDVMRRIAAWSHGRVTANDFYGIQPRRR